MRHPITFSLISQAQGLKREQNKFWNNTKWIKIEVKGKYVGLKHTFSRQLKIDHAFFMVFSVVFFL